MRKLKFPKPKIPFKRLLVLVLICPMASYASSFFDNHQEGWFWYQVPIKKEKPKNDVEISKIEVNPTDQMKAYQKKVEDSLNMAILYPTEKNLKAYAHNYYEVINRAQQFTDAYQLMLLKNPSLDYTLRFPVNPIAQAAYTEKKEFMTHASVSQFARTHGFFFFFSGACKYCHIFAPVVKQFSRKYGISVLAISMDGSVLPDFPKAQLDNGAARAFKVAQFPALFAVHPKSKRVIPVAYGALTLNQLEENVLRVMNFEKQYEITND